MIFKYFIINALNLAKRSHASKGENHQHKATPCNWSDDPFIALKGRNLKRYMMSPLQGLNLRIYPFHRTLPDANAKRLSALTLVISCLFFIPKQN